MGSAVSPRDITSFYLFMSVETPRSYMQIHAEQRQDTKEKSAKYQLANQTRMARKDLKFIKCPLLSKWGLEIETDVYKASVYTNMWILSVHKE